MNTNYDFSLSAIKIQKLLAQFFEYMQIFGENEILKEKIWQIQNPDEKQKLQENIKNNENFLQKLGNDMKFDNPFIWMYYKILAYKWRKNEISTIWDFIKHCEWKTDICHQRFDFLNKNLKEKYNIDLFEENPEEKLEDFVKKWFIEELSKNENFMKKWLECEYFIENWKVAKWRNYKK